MKTKTIPQVRSKWLMFFPDGRLVLSLLLIGYFACFLLVCFKHLPGLHSWAVPPIINGLATFWLLAKSQTQFLNRNK